MGKLSPVAVKNAKPGRYADGEGLYLLVKPSGSKSWLLRIQQDGRRRDFGLGSLKTLSLAEARDKARDMRRDVRNGGDPAAARRARRGLPTFKEAATQCHSALKSSWTDRHALVWLASLEEHVFPGLGSTRVDKVDASQIADALKGAWLTVPNSARRCLQRIGTVLDYSIAHKWRTADNPLRSVRHLLPKHKDREKHFAAVPFTEVPSLMATLLSGSPSIPQYALAFQILTAARPNEVRFMTWGEVDLVKAVWSIPADKMKMARRHEVPLSSRALAILRELAGLFGGAADDLVFPGRDGRAMAITTPMRVMKRAGRSETAHGTARSSFSDWANESTQFKKAVIECALAHDNPDRVEAAYRRTTFFDQRVQLMEQWAEFLIPQRTEENVVPLVRVR